MAESKKAIFHIYKIIWKGDPDEINFQLLEKTLNETPFYPDDKNTNKSVFHEVKFYESKEINFIYGYFVKYYKETITTIENPDGSIDNSEWYPFVYLVNEDIFLFQHKMGYGDKHSISEVRDEFLKRIKDIFLSIGVPTINSIEKHQISNDRKIFLDKFFDKTNKIKKVILEDLDQTTFNKTVENGQYTYFNPVHDESESVIQTEGFHIEHVKKMEMEAKDGKTLGKVPSVRIGMAAAENIKLLQGENQQRKEFLIVNKVDNIESSIDERPKLSDIINVINDFYQSYLGNEIIPIVNKIDREELNKRIPRQPNLFD